MNFRLDTIYKLHGLAFYLKISPFELIKNLNEQGFCKIEFTKKILENPYLCIQHDYYY